MKLTDYYKENKEDFEVGGGIPEGDTYFSKECEIEPKQVEFNGVKKTVYELTSVEAQKYRVGKSVINGLMEKINNGHEFIRVTRSGKGQKDTRYTFLGFAELPSNIKITKEVH